MPNSYASPSTSRGAVTVAGLACVALPLCGGGGLPQAAILGSFLVWSGLRTWRNDRILATTAWVFAGLTVAVLAAYFVDFHRSENMTIPERWTDVVQAALGFASYALGGFPNDAIWKPTGALVLIVPAAGFLALARSQPRDAITRAIGAGTADRQCRPPSEFCPVR